jgi:prepilin-type N-terminal cleavage/methylation domain-containing protein
MPRQPGFTLIELLFVCTILAALAYVGVGVYADTDRRAGDELARVELLRLADALNRFRGDTGYWPGEGPFQLNEGCAAGLPAAIQSVSSMPSGSAPSPWHASPANLSLLFEAPVLCPGHPLAFLQAWRADARRGWNGPYLSTARRHWVDMSANLTDIPAFGAGPALAPNPDPPADCAAADLNKCAFNWKRFPAPATGARFTRHARPFLFYPAPPRVLYAGADGRYESASLKNDACPLGGGGGDDVLICL